MKTLILTLCLSFLFFGCKKDKTNAIESDSYCGLTEIKMSRYNDSTTYLLHYSETEQLTILESRRPKYIPGFLYLNWNDLNRLSTFTIQDYFTGNFKYDEDGRLLEATTNYPDNKKIVYEYDELGKLTQALFYFGHFTAGVLKWNSNPYSTIVMEYDLAGNPRSYKERLTGSAYLLITEFTYTDIPIPQSQLGFLAFSDITYPDLLYGMFRGFLGQVNFGTLMPKTVEYSYQQYDNPVVKVSIWNCEYRKDKKGRPVSSKSWETDVVRNQTTTGPSYEYKYGCD